MLNFLIYLALVLLSLYLLRYKRQYLKGADSLFVSGDINNTILIHAVVTTKSPLTHTKLKQTLQQHIAIHTRFRQRLVKRQVKWHYYETDEAAFNLDKHIRKHTLDLNPTSKKKQSAHEALEAYVSTLIQTPINMSRPPWDVTLIEKYGKTGEGSAVIVRVHHAIGDGVTLMKLAQTLLKEVDGDNASPDPTITSAVTPPTSFTPLLPSTFVAKNRYRKPRPVAPSPSSSSSSSLSSFLPFMRSVFKILFLKFDPTTIFKPRTALKIDIPCHARWLPTPFSLPELKELSYATGTSVNDILYTIVTGGLREYAKKRGQDPSTFKQLNTIMWVALQGLNEKSNDKKLDSPTVADSLLFGNNIGSLILDVPIREPNSITRLKTVRDMTSVVSTSPEPYVARFLMASFGYLPQFFLFPLFQLLAMKPSSSMSNIPGPTGPVSWGQDGPLVDSMVFFVAPQGRIPTFITMLSYNQRIQLGIVSDSRTIHEPKEVLDLCIKEYAQLKDQIDRHQKMNRLKDAFELQESQRRD